MLLSTVLLATLFAVAQADCPQETYKDVDGLLRTEFEVGTNAFGFDLRFWNREGDTLVGDGGDVAVGTGVLPVGTSLSSTDAVPNPTQSLLDLKTNGDEVFLLAGDVPLTGASQPNDCWLTVGGAPAIQAGGASGGFCITRDNEVLFRNRFKLVPKTAADGSGKFVIKARRHLSADGKSIQIDLSFTVNGQILERVSKVGLDNLPAAVWDIGTGGLVLNAPLTGQTTDIDQIVTLYGRVPPRTNPASGFDAPIDNFDAAELDSFATGCLLERWQTRQTGRNEQPYVVPGLGGTGNLRLRYVRTNFLVAPTAAVGMQSYKFETDAATDFALRPTAFPLLAGATFSPANTEATYDGNLRSNLQFDALAVGASATVTFVATALPCFPSLLEVVTSDISVASVDATISSLREARLEFVVRDLRPFDMVNLPIAAGCDVPLNYTVDVVNRGPSCVTNLQLDLVGGDEGPAARGGAPNSAGGVTGGPVQQTGDLEPGEFLAGDPVPFSATATAAAPNQQFFNRSLVVVSPEDGGLFSTFDQPEPYYEFYRREAIGDERFKRILNLTYDVTRYSDLTVEFEFRDDVTAGDFASLADTNLIGDLTVTNHGCINDTDIVIVIKIELPAGTTYLENAEFRTYTPGVPATHNKSVSGSVEGPAVIERSLLIAALAPEAEQTEELQFAVCQYARASAAGLNVQARVLRVGDTTHSGELTQYERERPSNNATELFGESLDDAYERVVVVRPFDDQVSTYANIELSADLVVTLDCDDSRLVATSALDRDADDDDSEDSSSSSASPDSSDVDLVKLTRCTVKTNNVGLSNTPYKVIVNWFLPSGSRLVRWSTTTGSTGGALNQFVLGSSGGVFAVAGIAGGSTSTSDLCSTEIISAGAAQQNLELDFASTAPGTFQIVARVDKTSSAAASLTGSFGGAVTRQV